MGVYDLYGFTDDDLETARPLVEQALDISLEPRTSFHYGDYYGRGMIGDEEIVKLTMNWNPYLEEFNEEDFPNVPVVLYISNIRSIERAQEIERILKERIPGVQLLGREVWGEGGLLKREVWKRSD